VEWFEALVDKKTKEQKLGRICFLGVMLCAVRCKVGTSLYLFMVVVTEWTRALTSTFHPQYISMFQ
jgi:hypothetical protein